jgi:SWI/SNF-related matrix-associated actin-dependent regulator of chromatin subfamily A member 5
LCRRYAEGHKVKSDATQVTAALSKIRRRHTVILTGTPLQNNLRELYCLLTFLHPLTFTTSTPFEAAFDLSTNIVNSVGLYETLIQFTHSSKAPGLNP